MMALPPDLERLGEQLAAAAGTRRDARRRRAERRRRVATAGVVGALAFAVLTPTPLNSGVRDLARTSLADADSAPLGCDHPRGATFRLPACEGPMILYRPYAVR
jgi:hypothetical protein